MSDYLSNLIARSFNQREIIQPRLLSRFERPQQSGEPVVEQILELEREDRALQSPRVSLSSPRETLKANFLSQPPTSDLLPSSPTQPIARESVAPSTPTEQKFTPAQIVQQRFVEQVSVSKDAHATANPQSESPFLPKRIAPRQTPPVIQPQIVSLPESVTSSVPIAKTEPPTVNVTIGRVEVRAIAPSSPPRQSPKPPTPNLSLEDYLRSGNGGRL